ncbi:hypothetical protein, partial [Streptomyces tateyamensis]|uniref:hypothetical protein n=1 Tax=Streptomyces tateyamensis TaxID=565073 RepID=UPI001C6473E5
MTTGSTTPHALVHAAEHATAAKEPFLFLYITEKCQLRCKHCYMGDRLDAERRMTPAMVEDILSSLRVAYLRSAVD